MQVAGFTLLGIGVAGVVTGIVLASSADWETHSTGTGVTTTTRDPQGGAGIIVLAAGIPFTVAGIVLGAIGTSKRNEYKRRLEFSGFDIKTTPRYQSFGLCFTINK